MRYLALSVALAISCSAFADRLLLIPVGKKIFTNAYRYEILTEPSRDNAQGWIGTGLGHSFDLEVTGESFDSNRVTNSLDFSYNYTVPIVDFLPGISFGVQDLMNVTRRGRNLYAVTTFRFGNVGRYNQDVPTELTIGFWTRSEGLMFAGVTIPFSESLSVMAEHDGENLTGGFEITPVQGASFRFMYRQNQVLFGFRVQKRF